MRQNGDRLLDQLEAHLNDRLIAIMDVRLLSHARRFRQHAEECRVVAEMMTHPGSRASLLGVAASYDALADQAEKLAVVKLPSVTG